MIDIIVRKYLAVFVFSLIIVIMGTVSYITLPRESAPEIRRPLIFITTIYPGVSAKDIESLITRHIEDELDGLEGLDKLTSTSRQGMSSVVAEFTGDTEVEIALRRVKERVDLAKPELPAEVDEPTVRELNFSDQPFLILVLSNKNGLSILENVVDFLEEEIKSVQGVLEVRISGKLQKELAVELDPTRLKHYGYSIDDVINSIRSEHITIPGGVIKNDKQQFSLAVTGEISDESIFDELIIKSENKKIKLGALGTAQLKDQEPETISRLNGVPAVSLSVTKRSGENLIAIVDQIKEIVEKNEFRLPSGTEYQFSFDESEAIKDMVYDLENNIVTSFILVVGVTLFFLGPVNAIFVSIGIPFSMLLSFTVLSMMGITLNMVVLFSLVLALGMLVDNGIVIVENIYRHKSMGKTTVRAAAAHEHSDGEMARGEFWFTPTENDDSSQGRLLGVKLSVKSRV